MDTIKELCQDSPYSSCSNQDLTETLTLITGKLRTFSEQGQIISTTDYNSIVEPARAFSSKAGYLLGGPSVRLLVFYNEKTGDVLGWVNMGSAMLKIDLNAQKKR